RTRSRPRPFSRWADCTPGDFSATRRHTFYLSASSERQQIIRSAPTCEARCVVAKRRSCGRRGERRLPALQGSDVGGGDDVLASQRLDAEEHDLAGTVRLAQVSVTVERVAPRANLPARRPPNEPAQGPRPVAATARPSAARETRRDAGP